MERVYELCHLNTNYAPNLSQAAKDAIIHLFNMHAVSCRPITTESIRKEMALRLCFRDKHGNPSPLETAHPICNTKAVRQFAEHFQIYLLRADITSSSFAPCLEW